MSNTPGKVVVRASGKRGVLASGKAAVFNAAGLCPACCGGAPDTCFHSPMPASVLVTVTGAVVSGYDACVAAAVNGSHVLGRQDPSGEGYLLSSNTVCDRFNVLAFYLMWGRAPGGGCVLTLWFGWFDDPDASQWQVFGAQRAAAQSTYAIWADTVTLNNMEGMSGNDHVIGSGGTAEVSPI